MQKIQLASYQEIDINSKKFKKALQGLSPLTHLHYDFRSETDKNYFVHGLRQKSPYDNISTYEIDGENSNQMS